MARKKRFNLTEETERNFIKEIIAFFLTERDEEIGVIAAQEVLDFFLNTIGDEIYKKGVDDAKKMLKEKIEDLETDLDLLSEH